MKTKFVQVCVWPATVVGKDKATEFVSFMKKNFGVRVKYAEEILTLPDMKNGSPVPDTGERNDLFFYVHNDDIGKFAVPRLTQGIRWVEDVVSNGDAKIYPKGVLDKYK